MLRSGSLHPWPAHVIDHMSCRGGHSGGMLKTAGLCNDKCSHRPSEAGLQGLERKRNLYLHQRVCHLPFQAVANRMQSRCHQNKNTPCNRISGRTPGWSPFEVGRGPAPFPRGKHRITSHWPNSAGAIVDSLKRLNVETPHPYTCLHPPKIANNVPPSSGKHSANTYPLTAFWHW